MSDPMKCRPTPCASCPYRRDVPSGVWDATEYVKLAEYDRPLPLQPMAPFMCHQPTERGETMCAGWVHTHGDDLLALRLGLAIGRVDRSVIEDLDRGTEIPLFASGAEAGEHGLREVENPGPRARELVAKIENVREATDWTPPENVV